MCKGAGQCEKTFGCQVLFLRSKVRGLAPWGYCFSKHKPLAGFGDWVCKDWASESRNFRDQGLGKGALTMKLQGSSGPSRTAVYGTLDEIFGVRP